jgi:hypothetical protein
VAATIDPHGWVHALDGLDGRVFVEVQQLPYGFLQSGQVR